jgi:hypothetical protein
MTPCISDHVIPVVRGVVESHDPFFEAQLQGLSPKLRLHIRTLTALLISAVSVSKALGENNEQIPKPVLAFILSVQATLSIQILALCGEPETLSETSVTLPTGHRLPTNLDRHDR